MTERIDDKQQTKTIGDLLYAEHVMVISESRIHFIERLPEETRTQWEIRRQDAVNGGRGS